MGTLRRSRGAALATAVLVAGSGAALTGCGTATGNPERRDSGRAAVPTPDLCRQLDRDLIRPVIHGKAKTCENKTEPPDKYLVRFTGESKPPGGKAGTGSVTVTYLLRSDPKTGHDRWNSISWTNNQRRVKLLSIGDDAVFDYAGPGLAVLKGDLIVIVSRQLSAAPEAAAEKDLPSHMTDIAAKALAQTG